MKTALSFLVCLSAFAQVSPVAATLAPAVDKVKLESYLRRLEAWPPIINVKIDDPKPAPDIPAFYTVAVHLSYNDQHLDQSYFISRDGQKIFKGDVYDLNKSPFQANLDKLHTDTQPAFGAPADAAPVSLLVFGDFECPYCKEEASTLRQQIPSTFPGKVRVYFMDFPLESIHPWSRAAAIAGRCVYKQGEDAFWKYHDWIYEHQTEVTPDNYNSKLMEWAGANGVDAVQLGRCVDSKATDAEVTRTQAMGHELGVDGTPTLYLNGRKLMDQLAQWGTLQQLIALEIDQQAKLKEEEEKCCTLPSPSLIKK
jgi:protein-disulfide isomerase